MFSANLTNAESFRVETANATGLARRSVTRATRLDRLTSSSVFAAAAIDYNRTDTDSFGVATRREKEAQEKALRADPCVRSFRCQWDRSRREFVFTVERYVGLSADELAALVSGGDEHAELALVARYVPLLESMAKGYGTHTVYDEDDAFQDAALVLLESARLDRESGSDTFSESIRNDVRSRLGDESARMTHPMQVSRRVRGRIQKALDATGGNLEAAAEYAANRENPADRMPRVSFFAAYHAIHGGLVSLEDDEADEALKLADTLADPQSERPFTLVTDTEAAEELITSADLSIREAQAVRLVTGMYGDPLSHDEAADVLHVSRPLVSRAYKSAMAKLRTAATARLTSQL